MSEISIFPYQEYRVSGHQVRSVLQLTRGKHIESSLEVSADTGNIVDTVGRRWWIFAIHACCWEYWLITLHIWPCNLPSQ